MAERLSSKVALVTGRSSSIGKATAPVFRRQGGKVLVADIGVDGGEETVSLIRNTGGEATFIKTDVIQAVNIENLIGKTVASYGQLDCAFNNAGIAGDLALTADSSEKHWNHVIIQTAIVKSVINAQPEKISETVVWLCSDAASFVTGHAIASDGGYVAQ